MNSEPYKSEPSDQVLDMKDWLADWWWASSAESQVSAQLYHGLPSCTSNADYDSRAIPHAFELSILNICDGSCDLKCFSKKNIKNAFLFHGLVHSTVLPQVLQPQLLFVSIFHSLFYPDERFLKAFSFTVYKNGSATGILREQAASTTRHYFVHCLWLLGINLTKGFLRNQEQDPTFVKESIKQNQSPRDLGEKRKNNEIPDPVFA